MAMLSRYRILDAILALREFTVGDLAGYSRARENTVRTVLGRDSRFVERIGTRADGRRGGQHILYRLRCDTEDELVGILRELDGIGANLPPHPQTQEDDPVMLSLISAENVLLHQLPQAPPAERADLVHLAIADYHSVQMLAGHDGTETAAHRRVVELLLRLAEVEQEALQRTPPGSTGQPDSMWRALGHDGAKKVEAIGHDLYDLLPSIPVLNDPSLLPDLIRRVANSCLGQAILRAGYPINARR
ncbi:hypothetical protein [Actinoplanes sp. NPDC026670]|uniref:hypothetical protein n=1 Tax=Actinoplanes sp. NPDC026670 TaxID=3154700 RepID=UPI0033CE7852